MQKGNIFYSFSSCGHGVSSLRVSLSTGSKIMRHTELKKEHLRLIVPTLQYTVLQYMNRFRGRPGGGRTYLTIDDNTDAAL
jgi:hypothetical protein